MFAAVLQFPLRHWRGQVSTLPTIVGTVLALRLVLFWAGGIPILADIAVLIWQLVGGWRSASRYQDETVDLPGFLAAIGGLGIAVILTMLPHLDNLADRSAVPPPAWEPPETGVEEQAGALLLSGEIDFPMVAAVEQALAKSPAPTLMVIDSPGGRIHAARGLARLVRDHDLSTRVDNLCASACTLAFIAGKNRSLGPQGRLGFHGYDLSSPMTILGDVREEEARDREMFLELGIDPEFVSRIYATDHADMWFPPREKMLQAGILIGD